MAALKHIDTVTILNIDKQEASTNISPLQLFTQNEIQPSSYIISDADQELLILTKFKTNIDLLSIKIHALEMKHDDLDTSPPKQIHIYKINNLNVNFEDIKELTPDISIKCTTKKLAKGQNIKLQKHSKNVLKFKQIQYMAIYIASNLGHR